MFSICFHETKKFDPAAFNNHCLEQLKPQVRIYIVIKTERSKVPQKNSSTAMFIFKCINKANIDNATQKFHAIIICLHYLLVVTSLLSKIMLSHQNINCKQTLKGRDTL
jgi:hypothetical protein